MMIVPYTDYSIKKDQVKTRVHRGLESYTRDSSYYYYYDYKILINLYIGTGGTANEVFMSKRSI